MPSRREFMQQLGLTLSAALLGGQLASKSTFARDRDYRKFEHPAWKALQQQWYDLDQVAEVTRNHDFESKSDDIVSAFSEQHRKILDELESDRQIKPAQAQRIQAAYDEAAYHLYRSNSMMTCYDMSHHGALLMKRRDECVKRAELLEKMARERDLDDEVITKAKAALEVDMALFDALAATEKLDDEHRWAEWSKVIEAFEKGDMEVDEDDVLAAKTLVVVLFLQYQ